MKRLSTLNHDQSSGPHSRFGIDWHSPAMLRFVRRIGVATTVGMFIVLLMGATVTNTGSAQGCGRSWPLCHGKFIPTFALSTAIEFSHRAVTGVETILIIALAIGAWVQFGRRREIRWLVPLMLFFLFLQAALGALAVKYPTSPEVLALHFGISLSAFASVLLTTVFLYDARGREKLRNRSLSRGLRGFIWGALAYLYVIVYLGAYVRHSNASMACTDWPLCQGKIFPGFGGDVGLVFIHRLAAAAGVLVLGGLVLWAARHKDERPDLYWGSLLSFGFILLQCLLGAVVVFARMDLFSTISHAGGASLVFGALSYLCYQTLRLPATAAEPLGSAARPLPEDGQVAVGSTATAGRTRR